MILSDSCIQSFEAGTFETAQSCFQEQKSDGEDKLPSLVEVRDSFILTKMSALFKKGTPLFLQNSLVSSSKVHFYFFLIAPIFQVRRPLFFTKLSPLFKIGKPLFSENSLLCTCNLLLYFYKVLSIIQVWHSFIFFLQITAMKVSSCFVFYSALSYPVGNGAGCIQVRRCGRYLFRPR